MGWIISPDEGVTNNGNGSFVLPCSDSNVVYSITYVDGVCSSNTISYTYVATGTCTYSCPGSCTNTFAQGVAYNTTSTTIAAFYSGHTDFTACGLVAGDNILTATWGEDWSGHSGWKTINVTMNQNQSTSDRTCKFSVTATTTANTTCTYNFSFVQSANTACEIASANCTKWQGYNLPATGASDYPVAVVGYCNGYTAFTEAFATSYSFVRNIRETSETGGPCILDGRRIVVDLDANTSTSTRNFTINFTGRTSDGKSCTQSLTWTQDGASPTPTCDCNSITYSGTYEDDPAPVEEQFKVQIQIHNATNDTIYWDVIDFNFADGKEEAPETCDSCQDNTTKTWNYGGASSHDDWVSFASYKSTDTPTLSSALINLTDSRCTYGAGVKTLTTTQTTWHNGDTILLQYNG
jgi:hypothetical protein